MEKSLKAFISYSHRELINLLKRLGFNVVRQRGSHTRLEYKGQFVTVPPHKNIKPGLLQAILKSVFKMTRIELDELYKML